MPTTCPPIYHCGTHIPVWLHGTHPSAADGIVTREVCGNVPSGGCCRYKSTIRVKQCNTATSMFYVYELQPTHGCSVAYCAGKKALVYSLLVPIHWCLFVLFLTLILMDEQIRIFSIITFMFCFHEYVCHFYR